MKKKSLPKLAGDLVEVAIHEVWIDGKWVEWGRAERTRERVWDGQAINQLKPQTRVRFERLRD